MRRLWAFLVALFLLPSCSKPEAARTDVTFAVAASLRGVMPELVAAYKKEHGDVEIVATYGASGSLRQQVQGGAPIDGVLFSNAATVDELIQSGHADPATRKVVATNALVLIAPQSSPKKFTWETLDSLGPDDKLAIGEPGAVPAGRYARDALRDLGKWDAVQKNLVLAGDVAAVLAYARRGEVAAAVVYKTETHNIKDIVILDEATGPWAPRAEVVVAVTNGGDHAAEATRFLEFVVSPAGQAILQEFGFGAP